MGRELRAVHDAVLGAEQAAARVAARRHRSLWDLLVSLEDAGRPVVVDTAGGRFTGRPTVGADHVVVDGTAVPLDAVVWVRPA